MHKTDNPIEIYGLEGEKVQTTESGYPYTIKYKNNYSGRSIGTLPEDNTSYSWEHYINNSVIFTFVTYVIILVILLTRRMTSKHPAKG